ncbi:MAG: S9 family peptidase [Acidobacteria bacterium]|nr:S9 family peptidase [Acidobacteriota bacterium]
MRRMLPLLICFVMLCSVSLSFAENAAKHWFGLDDFAALREVADPQLSPDGEWVAYTVRTADSAQDKLISHIWLTNWEGTRHRQMTFSKEGESHPRWTPDGKYLSFLSSRGVEGESDQVWLMPRDGGEGERITSFPGDVSDFAWSPDSQRLALIVADADPDKPGEGEKHKPLKPIVIDRFYFQEDKIGYLRNLRNHLYVFDLSSRKAELLTPGKYYESQPAWSPDSKSIVFVSKREEDFDRNENWDLYLIVAERGAEARQLTTFKGKDSLPDWDAAPAWSHDGKWIAYAQGAEDRSIEYAVRHLAIISPSGGQPTLLTAALDRNISEPRWSADDNYIYFTIEDDRADRLARIRAQGGSLEDISSGRRELAAYNLGAHNRTIALISTPQLPAEVFAVEDGHARQLTRQNEELLEQLTLASTEEITFKSKDGTLVHGLMVKPPDFRPGMRYPTILRIHGGPVYQFSNEFSSEWQFFAAHGYVVVGANPRGSSGRGEAYAKAIYADWGARDSEDVLAAVDYAVAQGISDPTRLAVGGWSYGGMLTDQVIARDRRFKAATSGASIADIFAGYGTDQYVRDYENELGRPWEHPDVWVRVSYPFFHANQIVTPTLFLCGDKDANVPLLNSEQMYESLQSLRIPTQLIIYPGQYHEIAVPSYLRDRLARYLDWYDKYAKAPARAGKGAGFPGSAQLSHGGRR